MAASKKSAAKTPIKPKAVRSAKPATATSHQTEVKDIVVHKRMASLNASAMLAAAYEVERHMDRVEAKYDAATSDGDAPSPIKDIKNEDKDEKDVSDRRNRKSYMEIYLFMKIGSFFNIFALFFSFENRPNRCRPTLSSFRTQM